MPSFRSDTHSLHMDHYCSYRYKGRRENGKTRQEFTPISSSHALHLHLAKRTKNFSFKNSLHTYSNPFLIKSYTNMNKVTRIFILFCLYTCHDNALYKYFEYFSF